MKYSLGNRIHIKVFLFLLVISLISLNGFADEKQGPEDTVLKTKAGKERLVARDIGRGGQIYLLRWCGDSGIVYRLVDTDDAEMLDFQTGKRTPINVGLNDILLNCSPDGRKLIYLPSESRTSHKGTEDPTVGLDPGGDGRYEKTIDMYMYDTVTGEKTPVATIREPIPYDAISPDGKKILLGERHRLVSKTGAPDLESVWFTEKWEPVRATWFPDSSGVLVYGTGEADTICIEIFGEDGWARCFDMKGTTDEPRADRENRVYFLDVKFDIMTELTSNFLHRCEIRKRELSCERIIKDHNVMPTYVFLPDGDIVFKDYEHDECIFRITPGEETARCVIYPHYADVVYDHVSLVGLSPDGRWLVFDRYTTRGWIEGPGGKTSWQGQSALFVIDLMGE